MSKPISAYSFEDIKNLFNPDGKNIHPFHTLYENFDTQSISLMHERQIETTLIFEDGSSKKVDYMYVEVLEFFVDSHTDTHEIISPKAFERLQVLESILQDISSTEETDGEERLFRFMTRMVKELEKLGILHDEYEKSKDEDDGTYIDE